MKQSRSFRFGLFSIALQFGRSPGYRIGLRHPHCATDRDFLALYRGNRDTVSTRRYADANDARSHVHANDNADRASVEYSDALQQWCPRRHRI